MQGEVGFREKEESLVVVEAVVRGGARAARPGTNRNPCRLRNVQGTPSRLGCQCISKKIVKSIKNFSNFRFPFLDFFKATFGLILTEGEFCSEKDDDNEV